MDSVNRGFEKRVFFKIQQKGQKPSHVLTKAHKILTFFSEYSAALCAYLFEHAECLFEKGLDDFRNKVMIKSV